MTEISCVARGSLAEHAGVLVGDILISINDHPIHDVLDYRFYLAERHVTLKIHRGPELLDITINKGEYDDIGLDFATPLMDKKHACKNKCIFCFIDQLPRGMRESLYFKDDDSRLSFIHGNYITLTNLTDEDIDRMMQTERAISLVRNVLTERERQIIILRFGLGGIRPLTQRQIAEKMGISRSYVSRIEKSALARLKEYF